MGFGGLEVRILMHLPVGRIDLRKRRSTAGSGGGDEKEEAGAVLRRCHRSTRTAAAGVSVSLLPHGGPPRGKPFLSASASLGRSVCGNGDESIKLIA
jgi:hypothetical protein